jgi:hypothetical protein
MSWKLYQAGIISDINNIYVEPGQWMVRQYKKWAVDGVAVQKKAVDVEEVQEGAVGGAELYYFRWNSIYAMI